MRGIYAREHAAKVQTPASRRAKLVHLVFPLCNDSLKREHWICFRSSWKKRICPPATAWHPSLLAHIINYKLTISKSHGQTRVKRTQHGDKVFLFFFTRTANKPWFYINHMHCSECSSSDRKNYKFHFTLLFFNFLL